MAAASTSTQCASAREQRGLLQPGRVLSDEEALQLILEPGFSTASTVTQHAGRGVGMDVVVTEIKKLGGALFTESQPGKGVKFTIRLPFTLAITQALIVRTGEELYALPLPSVEGVARVPRSEVREASGRRVADIQLRRSDLSLPASRCIRRRRSIRAARS